MSPKGLEGINVGAAWAYVSLIAISDTYALLFVLPAHIEPKGISVKYPPDEAICLIWHMFSCGGSIFDFAKGKEKKEGEKVGTLFPMTAEPIISL